MPINNDLNPGAAATPDKYYKQQAESTPGWRELVGGGGTPPRRRSKGKGRLYTILSTLLLVMLILAAVRVTSVASGKADELVLKVGSQQQALIDLRQSLPISPYLFGVNVFPENQTQDAFNNYSGFMSYGPQVVNGLTDAGIKLLRFPGGSWARISRSRIMFSLISSSTTSARCSTRPEPRAWYRRASRVPSTI
jgi:hypothetical protein